MEFQEILKFIKEEDVRMREHFYPHFDQEKVILARAVKLSEEVGELSDEILRSLNVQRKEKMDGHSHETLAKEVADVFMVTLLLAQSLDVDVQTIVKKKIQEIENRYNK
ncbi:hypothetical protein COT97_02265 [Candidatus Falkowbacteria bacterium CG10_big_fil_rev_8_21_14_0_10_39_11]|uniref:NTP pyrophosphohydrolase MazG-like domain-containing protein n=1 Tax=Candidatus Falkowbacteria bacterium CG10_big_fil_rev_8_21_14_0_10_39_11 TaxID=1974565 RepID=A0A2H0V7G6_9BACT|nr:MAG: hypothetical protein COT97_02265 [Candidatus Falkowbacteria bacterium CG10_big_fil_rev_8_21_14_0_10_39_11]